MTCPNEPPGQRWREHRLAAGRCADPGEETGRRRSLTDDPGPTRCRTRSRCPWRLSPAPARRAAGPRRSLQGLRPGVEAEQSLRNRQVSRPVRTPSVPVRARSRTTPAAHGHI